MNFIWVANLIFTARKEKKAKQCKIKDYPKRLFFKLNSLQIILPASARVRMPWLKSCLEFLRLQQVLYYLQIYFVENVHINETV